MRKLVYVPIITLIVLANFLILYVGYMMLYPFKVLDAQIEVTTPVVRKGECAPVRIVGDKYYDVTSITSWYLVDGVSTRLSEFTGRQRPVGHFEDTLCIVLPDARGVPNHSYRLQLNVSYEIFPLRRPISYSFISNEFQLVN